MASIDEDGYVERTTPSKSGKNGKPSKRNWWLVKSGNNGYNGIITFKSVSLPKELIGERVRLKLEVIK